MLLRGPASCSDPADILDMRESGQNGFTKHFNINVFQANTPAFRCFCFFPVVSACYTLTQPDAESQYQQAAINETSTFNKIGDNSYQGTCQVSCLSVQLQKS